jgi:hypothetical protein
VERERENVSDTKRYGTHTDKETQQWYDTSSLPPVITPGGTKSVKALIFVIESFCMCGIGRGLSYRSTRSCVFGVVCCRVALCPSFFSSCGFLDPLSVNEESVNNEYDVINRK